MDTELLTKSKLCNIYQIYFDEKSRGHCYDGFQLYDNTGKLTPFFENEVIYELCEKGKHKEDDYFGVVSHSLFFKAHRTNSPNILEQVIAENPEIDVFCFGNKSRNKNIILQAENYHKGFVDLFEKVIIKAGVDYNFKIVKNADKNVFSNHVIAKSDVYDRYFNEVLKPCMNVMRTDPELQEALWQDSKYYKSKKQAQKAYLQAQYGAPYYTYHTFICERLWTLFLWMNPEVSFYKR